MMKFIDWYLAYNSAPPASSQHGIYGPIPIILVFLSFSVFILLILSFVGISTYVGYLAFLFVKYINNFRRGTIEEHGNFRLCALYVNRNSLIKDTSNKLRCQSILYNIYRFILLPLSHPFYS